MGDDLAVYDGITGCSTLGAMKTFDPRTTNPDSIVGPDLLEEFRDLYRSELGEELSKEQALEKAIHLIALFRAIYKPIPLEKRDIYKDVGI